MARARNLSWLITQVRSRTDQERGNAIDDVNHLIPWINNGIAAFFEDMIKANPDWYLVTDTITTTAGTLEYSVPEDCMLIRGVEYTTGGVVIELEEFMWQERNQSFRTPHHIRKPRYRFMRNGIDGGSAVLVFRPDPSNREYTIHYVPNPPEITSSIEFDGIAGFEDYVIEYACILVRNKQEEDPTPHQTLLAYQRERIQGLAGQRDVSGSAHIARVRRRRGSRVRGYL